MVELINNYTKYRCDLLRLHQIIQTYTLPTTCERCSYFHDLFEWHHKSLTNSERLKCARLYALLSALDGFACSSCIATVALVLEALIWACVKMWVRDSWRVFLLGKYEFASSKRGCEASSRRTFAWTSSAYTFCLTLRVAVVATRAKATTASHVSSRPPLSFVFFGFREKFVFFGFRGTVRVFSNRHDTGPGQNKKNGTTNSRNRTVVNWELDQ
jgi:hypothetical protein